LRYLKYKVTEPDQVWIWRPVSFSARIPVNGLHPSCLEDEEFATSLTDMLQRLQSVSFKIPHLEDTATTDYQLLDGTLQRQPNGTWHERQEQPRGREVLYEYKQINVVAGKIDYRRLDDTVDLFVDFPQRKICWRETATPNGGEYRCPYAVVSFE
jgi:hypothetical protein